MNQTTTIKVGLVEDQFLFREGLISILSNWSDIDIVFESPDGYSVLERLEKNDSIPDVMLLDLTLPKKGKEEYNGWKVLDDIKKEYPKIKVLILSVHDDDYLISKLIEEGAHGYLTKDSDPQEVYNAILSLYKNGSYINAQTLEAIQKKLNGKVKKTHEELTTREIEVLELVCQQMTTDEIAEKLFISTKTVNGHRNNLLQKTGSRNVTGLVMYAVKNNLIEFE